MSAQRQNFAGARADALGGVPADRQRLRHVVRGLVVPQLLASYVATARDQRMGSHRFVPVPDDETDPSLAPAVEVDDVAALCDAALHDDLDAAREIIERNARNGVPTSAILAQLLAPSAMSLGDKWLGDDCSFVDVTLGLGIFQLLLRDVSAGATYGRLGIGMPLQLRVFALLQEQHTLGTLITGEMFRAAGWAVRSEQPSSLNTLQSELRQTAYDAIGISVSSIEFLEEIPQLVRSLKRCSLNPDVEVIAGGSALIRCSPSQRVIDGVDHVAVGIDDVETLIRDLSDRLNHARSAARSV